MADNLSVEIWSDGACSGNPGPGGWGALLRFADGREVELRGGEPATTNNRMELIAPAAALESLADGYAVNLYTDSQYVKNGMTVWLAGWKRKGWLTADRKPVKNVDLWQRLESSCTKHRVTWHWVRGHSGHVENEQADALARAGMIPFVK